MLKGVIFDADGTLLNSMHIWNCLGKRYLKEYGIAADDKLEEILYPMSIEESSLYLKEHYRLNESVDTVAGQIVLMIRRLYSSEVSLKSGVLEYLRYLSSWKIPMIVVTSNDRMLLQAVFERLEICHFFCDVLSCSQLGASKREQRAYLAAADTIGTVPEHTVVFEDVIHGICAAKNAGFSTVAVEDDSNIRDKSILLETADFYIRDFTSPILKCI